VNAPVLDNVTYFAYMQAYRPQHQISVFGTWHTGIGDPLAYLRGLKSDGAILGCGYFPRNLRGLARRDGDVCCLSRDVWMAPVLIAPTPPR